MSLNKVMLLAALAKEVEHPLWAKTCSREKWPIGKVQRAAGGSSANRKEMHQATKTNPRVQAMRDNADGEGVTATTTRRGRRDMRAEEFTDSEKGLGQAARLAQEQSARRTRGRESLSERLLAWLVREAQPALERGEGGCTRGYSADGAPKHACVPR